MDKKYNLFDITSLFIVFVSFASLLLLSLQNFNPLISLSISLVITSLLYFKFKNSIDLKIKPDITLLIILAVALLLRWKPFLWIYGGQDQGIYTYMSSHYQNYGSNFIIDQTREKLTPEEKQIYDQEAHFDYGLGMNFHNHLITIKDLDKSQYFFELYPLHPLWMANFASVFGYDNRSYSLTFFSLLSIISIYFLTLKLSESKVAARIASLFFAINPLSVFFSRFSTSEILSVFFSTSMIYYFLNYWESIKSKKQNYLYLFLSVGFFFCLYTNHLGNFIFLITLPIIFFLSTQKQNKKLALFYIGIILTSIAVNLYYYYNSQPLIDIYSQLYSQISFSNRYYNIVLLFILSLIYLKLYSDKNLKQKFINFISDPKTITYTFVLVVLILSLKANSLTYTKDLDKDFLGKGLESLSYSSFVVYLKYFTPVLFALIPFAFYTFKNKYLKVISFLTLFFVFIRLYIQPTVRYQYYFARYLLPEALTYSLIISSIYLAKLYKSKKHQDLSKLIIIGVSAYFLIFSFSLLGNSELKKAKASLDQLTSYLSKDDLLINGIYFMPGKLPPPLSFYYNKHTIPTLNYQKTLMDYQSSIKNQFDNVYILYPAPIEDANLHQVSIIPIYLDQFEQGSRIPTQFIEDGFNSVLYKVINKELEYNPDKQLES